MPATYLVSPFRMVVLKVTFMSDFFGSEILTRFLNCNARGAPIIGGYTFFWGWVKDFQSESVLRETIL